MRAVIYARYSSHNQREESIEGQLRECYDFAKKNDLTVIGEYIDRALSGKTDQRPDFQRLIKDSEKHLFDAVIMYTLDRFARNRYDSAIYKARLKKNGVKLFYAKQPMPDTPESIILESVMEGYAEYYSENLARSIKRGMTENALHGLAMGSPPLGYKIENRRYVIDPVEAKAVQMIFDMYENGHSHQEIVDMLNNEGFRTSRGKEFNKNSLQRILRNDKYIGTYRYMDIVMEDYIPSIINKKQFEHVQELLHRNSHMKAHNKGKDEYILTGKLYCGHCGKLMIGESGTSKTGKLHHYYKCIGRKREHVCDKLPEKKSTLEQAVVKHTIDVVLTDENITLIAERTMQILEDEYKDTSYIDGLRERLRDTEKRLQNLLNAIEQGILTPSTRERLEALETDKDELTNKIELEELKKPVITEDAIITWLKSFRHGDITNKEYQRKIVDTLINKIYVYDDKVVIGFNTSDHAEDTILRSDIEGTAPLYQEYPNTIFFIKKVACVMFHIH